ncbi:MAG: hypothetical protein HY901_02120 [Deltaproteobacteria bacterium]|nr:hypothetical protein [Deltaproteobacteria bacterium]
MAKTDRQCWNVVRSAMKGRDLPARLADVLAKPWEELEPGQVRYESKVLTRAYLEFLEEQLASCPRRLKWHQVLQRRLEVLRPLVRRRLAAFAVVAGKRWFWAKVDTTSGRLVHWEVD